MIKLFVFGVAALFLLAGVEALMRRLRDAGWVRREPPMADHRVPSRLSLGASA